MADGRKPGPMCQASSPQNVYDGTMCSQESPVPGPMGAPSIPIESRPVSSKSPIQFEEYRNTANSVAGTVTMLTYDAFVRQYIYDPASIAISKQGERMVELGLMSRKEAMEWVVQSRNQLLLSIRDQKNTPLGRAIGEWKKPRTNLPTPESRLKVKSAEMPGATQEEVFDAIIRSGGKTNQTVNRLAVSLKWAGPVLVAVNIAVSVKIVADAPPEQRGRVAAGQAGSIVGGLGGGWVGAKAGCAGGAIIGAPFELIGAAPGCLVGGFLGALGLGYKGSQWGESAGESAYDFSHTVVEWLEK